MKKFEYRFPIVHKFAIATKRCSSYLNVPPMTPSPIPPNVNLAPHKRKITATARVRENADPLLPKNKKAKVAYTKAAPKVVALSTSTADSLPIRHRNPSMEDENLPGNESQDDALHAKDPSEIDEQNAIDVDEDTTDVIGISDTESKSEPELEVAEESCEAELSKGHFIESDQIIHTYYRTPIKRVDGTHLCILPCNTCCQIHFGAPCSWVPMPC